MSHIKQMSLPVGTRTHRKSTRNPFPLRYKLLSGGLVAFLLSMIAILQAQTAYNTGLALLDGIGDVNSTVVDASEKALEYLATSSQAAADYLSLPPESELAQERLAALQDNFASFRTQMFTLRAKVQTEAERAVIDTIETATYNRFWLSMGTLLSARQQGDDISSRLEYFAIDAQLTDPILPALKHLEDLNYQQMIITGDQAVATLRGQAVLLAVPVGLLALLVTGLSFWVRQTLRRYVTPALDLSMIAAWAVGFVLVGYILALPQQLHIMTQDAYRSISASSRLLVDANLANRAESSMLLDPSHKENWIQQYDTAMRLIELRLCGADRCTEQPFLMAGTSVTVNPVVEQTARAITPENSAAIGGVIPLIGNVTFADEAMTLEQARQAYRTYQASHQRLIQYLNAGDVAQAVAFNTGSESDQSEAAFHRLVYTMDQERSINRAVFDGIRTDQSNLLKTNQILLGVVAYLLIAVGVALGVWHRWRDL